MKKRDAKQAIKDFNTLTGHTKIVKSGSKLKTVKV